MGVRFRHGPLVGSAPGQQRKDRFADGAPALPRAPLRVRHGPACGDVIVLSAERSLIGE